MCGKLLLFSLLGSLCLSLSLSSLLGLSLSILSSSLVGGQSPLSKLDTNLISAGLQNELLVLYADNLANNTADRSNLVANLKAVTHFFFFFLTAEKPKKPSFLPSPKYSPCA